MPRPRPRALPSGPGQWRCRGRRTCLRATPRAPQGHSTSARDFSRTPSTCTRRTPIFLGTLTFTHRRKRDLRHGSLPPSVPHSHYRQLPMSGARGVLAYSQLGSVTRVLVGQQCSKTRLRDRVVQAAAGCGTSSSLGGPFSTCMDSSGSTGRDREARERIEHRDCGPGQGREN